MVNLKRYEFKFYKTNCDCHYVDNPNGDWVKFEDIKEFLPSTSNNTAHSAIALCDIIGNYHSMSWVDFEK